jgi:hypothetical protein
LERKGPAADPPIIAKRMGETGAILPFGSKICLYGMLLRWYLCHRIYTDTGLSQFIPKKSKKLFQSLCGFNSTRYLCTPISKKEIKKVLYICHKESE